MPDLAAAVVSGWLYTLIKKLRTMWRVQVMFVPVFFGSWITSSFSQSYPYLLVSGITLPPVSHFFRYLLVSNCELLGYLRIDCCLQIISFRARLEFLSNPRTERLRRQDRHCWQPVRAPLVPASCQNDVDLRIDRSIVNWNWWYCNNRHVINKVNDSEIQ